MPVSLVQSARVPPAAVKVVGGETASRAPQQGRAAEAYRRARQRPAAGRARVQEVASGEQGHSGGGERGAWEADPARPEPTTGGAPPPTFSHHLSFSVFVTSS